MLGSGRVARHARTSALVEHAMVLRDVSASQEHAPPAPEGGKETKSGDG